MIIKYSLVTGVNDSYIAYMLKLAHSRLVGTEKNRAAQVFVSMVTVALLALVALTSYSIVNRQKAIER